MTNITTPRPGEADQTDIVYVELEPGAPEAAAPSTGPARTDIGRRRHVSPLLAIGISAAAAALAIVAIATDDVGPEPAQPVTVPADDQPVPDGVPCPDNPSRAPTLC